MSITQARGTQVATYLPDGSDQRWLGHEGPIVDLSYSFTTPGGCNQLAGTLQRPASYRTDAIDPGRLVKAYRGSTLVWYGRLEEPVPTTEGWQLTAHGVGSFGDDYLAIYTGAWGTGTWNNAIDAAISRGLDWTRTQDIGAVSGLWTGQKVDSGGQTITDLLSLGTHKGGLTWTVRTVARGNVVSLLPLPTVANRILISGDPAARSIAAAPSTIYIRYQSTWDTTKTPAQFATTSVTRANYEAAHGRSEDLMDISSAGVYTAGQAQTVATNMLKRFQRVAFADAFTVQPGELLTQGGQPCDLGIFWADGMQHMTCELWLADYGYGGEVSGGPISILVGDYTYHDQDGTAVITPFESARHDFSSVLGAAVDALPVRVKPHIKHHFKHHK